MIYTTSIQSDGKILFGGSFTAYNGTTANRLIRLNPNGSVDTTFNTGTGFNSTIYTTSIQSDGKIIVGGQFTSYNGTTANRIVRLENTITPPTPSTCDTTTLANGLSCATLEVSPGSLTMYAGDATDNNDLCANGSTDTICS